MVDGSPRWACQWAVMVRELHAGFMAFGGLPERLVIEMMVHSIWPDLVHVYHVWKVIEMMVHSIWPDLVHLYHVWKTAATPSHIIHSPVIGYTIFSSEM
jgi:hypothetical protein